MMEEEMYKKSYQIARKVDFLTEYWERDLYAKNLVRAEEWGMKIDAQNKAYKKKHRLIDRYNV